MTHKMNRYSAIIEEIFKRHFQLGMRQFEFERDELEVVAKRRKLILPKNLGDLIYTFKFRAPLPDSIVRTAPPGEHWLIRVQSRISGLLGLV